jgi:hypothetical protein
VRAKSREGNAHQKILKSIDSFIKDKLKNTENVNRRESLKSTFNKLPAIAEIYAPVESRELKKSFKKNSLQTAISMININEKIKNHFAREIIYGNE